MSKIKLLIPYPPFLPHNILLSCNSISVNNNSILSVIKSVPWRHPWFFSASEPFLKYLWNIPRIWSLTYHLHNHHIGWNHHFFPGKLNSLLTGLLASVLAPLQFILHTVIVILLSLIVLISAHSPPMDFHFTQSRIFVIDYKLWPPLFSSLIISPFDHKFLAYSQVWQIHLSSGSLYLLFLLRLFFFRYYDSTHPSFLSGLIKISSHQTCLC